MTSWSRWRGLSAEPLGDRFETFGEGGEDAQGILAVLAIDAPQATVIVLDYLVTLHYPMTRCDASVFELGEQGAASGLVLPGVHRLALSAL